MHKKELIGQKIYKDFKSETKVSEKNSRTLVVKISTPDPDRSHDVVFPKGIITDNFMENPVVLFAHKYDSKPIAKCTSIKAQETGVIATVEFTPAKMNPEADMVFEMYKTGFLNAWSIGFIPKDYDINSDGGHDFKEWEILEFSSVPVPDNAKALTIMRSFGIEKEKEIEKKDVAEVVALSDIIGYLGFLVGAFEDNMVDPDCIEKMKQALQLLLSVVQDQAVLDKKEVSKLVVAKAGRSISAKHEELLKAACDHMDKAATSVTAVLESVSEGETGEGDSKALSESFIHKLHSQLKDTDKSIGLTLRLFKTIKKEKK